MVKLAGGWIDLNERYGDMFKGDFNPNICNKFTLKVLGLTHHCKDCKAPPQKKCFWQLHFAFCDECGERFPVWSKGCTKHPYSLGCNVVFKAVRDNWPDSEIEKILAAGVSVSVEDFADLLNNDAPQGAEDNDVLELAEMVADVGIGTDGGAAGETAPAEEVAVAEATPHIEVQQSLASPFEFRTGRLSRASQWMPTGLKGKEAKGMRRARAATERKVLREREATAQAEIAQEELVKEERKAKRAAEVAKRADEERARKGRTGYKRR